MEFKSSLVLFVLILLFILLIEQGLVMASITISNELKSKKEVTDSPFPNSLTHNNKTGIALFIKNNGQWNSNILFRANLSYAELYILRNGISMVKLDRTPFEENGHFLGEDGKINGVRVDMIFDNANTQLDFMGKKKGDLPHHYILPSTESKTAYAYAMIYVKSVYQGIDWRIYTTLFGELKHEFILHPEADVNQIKLLFEGHKNLKIIQNKLEIETPYGSIFEQPPYSFYLLNKGKIPTQYQLKGNTVQFEIPKNYNKKQFIVIDPTLIFSTYSGSTGNNKGFTGTYGENGTGYSAGIVFAAEFPTTTGSFQMNYVNGVDVGILKYDATGSNLLYATYLGGDDIDIPHSLLLDKNNNLLIFGTTTSTNFPMTQNAYQATLKRSEKPFRQIVGISKRTSDIFLARLSTNGQNLLNSTYIGGLGRDGINSPFSVHPTVSTQFIMRQLYYNYGDSYRGDISVDDQGNIYVSSVTESDDFPTINAHQSTFGGGIRDGVLFKMNSDMTNLIWSTYLGGNREDTLYNMKVLNDKIIVCGATNSTNSYLPTTGKFKPEFSGKNDTTISHADGIALNVNKSTGTVTDATYLGTNNGDQAYFIDSDAEGNLFVLGQTYGNYPKSSSTYGASNAGIFLQKLSPDLSNGLLSTTLGTVGSSTQPNISPTAFLVNNCGNIYITGFGNVLTSIFKPPIASFAAKITFHSSTTGLPITNDAYQSTTDGRDFYLMILSKDAKNLNYATFFGGNDKKEDNSDLITGEHIDGGTSRFDKNGIVYHAVCTGCDGSNSFPTTPNAYAINNRSSSCSNGFFKFDLVALRPQFNTNTRDLKNLNIKKGCTPFSVLFSNTTNGNGVFDWDFGDGTTVTKNDKADILHTYNNPGVYTVTLTTKNANSCSADGSNTTQITVEEGSVYNSVNDATICTGESFDLFITNANNISWKNVSTGEIISTQSRVTVSPKTTTEFELTAVVGAACQVKKNITVTIMPLLSTSFDMKVASFSKNESLICTTLASNISVEFENKSQNGINYSWDFGDGSTNNSNDSIINHDYKTLGIYEIQLVATNPNTCTSLVTSKRTLEFRKKIIIDDDTKLICIGDIITLSAPEISNPVWYINEELITRDSKPLIQPSEDTVYIARGLSVNGCQTSKMIDIKVININDIQLIKKGSITCTLDNTVEFELKRFVKSDELYTPINASKYQILYDMGDGNIYSTPHIIHNYTKKGKYNVSISIKQQNCTHVLNTQVIIPKIHIPNVITPNGDNKNDKLIVNNENNVNLKIYDRWGLKIFESDKYQNDWPPTGSNYSSFFNYEAIIEGGETCNGWIEVLSN